MAERRDSVPPGVAARVKFAQNHFREAQATTAELSRETAENDDRGALWEWRERMAKIFNHPPIHPPPRPKRQR